MESVAGNGTGKKKSFKVQLASKPYGYGILLDGARTGAETNKIGAGVFIADILYGQKQTPKQTPKTSGLSSVTFPGHPFQPPPVLRARAVLHALLRAAECAHAVRFGGAEWCLQSDGVP